MDPRSSVHLQVALSQRKEGEDAALEFADADLRGNRFVRADLCGGNFSGARLEKVNLSGAKCFATRFNRAQLQGAILNGADLTGAKLRGADLSQAKLEGTCLAQTDCTFANLGQTTGMPSSVAGMRIDQATVKRSKLTDDQVIELYRQGATLVELENFSPKVRQYCEPNDTPEHEVTVRRQVALEELERHYAKLSRSIPPALSASLPPSFSELLTSSAHPEAPIPSDHLHSIPQSHLLADTNDEILGAKLGAPLPALGPVRRFEATNRDGVRCVVVLYDPAADPSGLALAAFRRGVRNLSRIGELGAKTPVRIPDLLAVGINELGYVAKDLWNGNLRDIKTLAWKLERLLLFFKEICRSVAALHELGIVHRCLCPSTILLGDDLKPVLTDIDAIDLVELASRGESEFDYFAAPEEMKGLSAYSPTADVFSLGKVLHFVVTGEVPAAGPVTDKSIAFPKGTPRGICRIICKAIQSHPANRYQQVAELLRDLARYENADQVGCDGPLPERGDANGQISVPPSPKPNGPTVAQYPGLPLPKSAREPLSERFMRRIGPRLGALGAGGAGACLLVGVVAPALSFEDAEKLAWAFGFCVGLSLLYMPMPARIHARPRILVSIVTMLALWQVDARHLMAFRWSLTLRRGSLEQRSQAVQNLIRAGKRNLSGANLSRANLSRIDLSNADLRRARLDGANLRGSLLAESKFDGANLANASLEGTNLHLSNAHEAQGWLSTRCNARTRMPRGWTCLRGRPQTNTE